MHESLKYQGFSNARPRDSINVIFMLDLFYKCF